DRRPGRRGRAGGHPVHLHHRRPGADRLGLVRRDQLQPARSRGDACHRFVGKCFTALPQPGTNSMPFMLTINESEAPGPLHALDAAEQRWLTVGHTNLLGFAVAAACLAVGFTIFLGWLPRLFLSLSILIVLAAWIDAQNLGGILTGSSTDVGTGPIWILLALAFWPAAMTRASGDGEAAPAAAQDSPATG